MRDELHEFSGRETSLVWMFEWRWEQTPNSKPQAPKKHQVPNTKRQAPNSREAPSSKRGPRFGAWNLGFLWCLELGFWCFNSGISLELGAWDLELSSWLIASSNGLCRTGISSPARR